MSFIYRIALFFVRPFYFLFFRIKTKNKENIPDKNTPYIICANHISAHDICFIATRMHRQIFFVAKEEIGKNPIIRFFAKKLGVIFIKRGKADLNALRSSVNVVKNGNVLCIFPQGTRFRDVPAEKEQFKSGVGMIAYRAKADILPVYIHTKNNRAKFFGKVDVIFGEPIKYSELQFESGKFSEFEKATELIAEKIISLSPERNEK
ncbi:MAG: lysophospholipid acyltransferase family protein [Eubacteriales bacterium]